MEALWDHLLMAQIIILRVRVIGTLTLWFVGAVGVKDACMLNSIGQFLSIFLLIFPLQISSKFQILKFSDE